MSALKRGDADTHIKLVAKGATKICDASATTLAHIATAQRATAFRAVTNTPVLTAPESAISKIETSVADAGIGWKGMTQ